MAEDALDSVLSRSEASTISLDGRRLTTADLYAVAARPDVTRVKIFALKQSIGPLAMLPALRELDLTDPTTLDGLDELQQLDSLTLYAFPRIASLEPIGALTNLKKLLLSTPPGYDASRKCYEVESLEPLARLAHLESLTMRGICPKSGRLDPIRRLTGLRRLAITHVYMFELADYAQLSAALPAAEGHCLQPVFEAGWAGACPKCGRPRVVLTAPPPRTPRMACPVDDQARIERHVAAWNRARTPST
jgi:hypothetical protein